MKWKNAVCVSFSVVLCYNGIREPYGYIREEYTVVDEADKLCAVRDRLEANDRAIVNKCINDLDNLVFQLLGFAENTMVQMIHGEKPEKPKNDVAKAREALKKIHGYGEKLDLPVPVFEDDKSFLNWLLKKYACSMLHSG